MKSIITSIFCLYCIFASGQQDRIWSDRIHTLRTLVNGKWGQPSILTLGTGDYLEISFDDFTHQYTRYMYKVTHCDASWKPTKGLFETDYLEGVNGELPIENYKQSLNTTMLYTHYSFQLPNRDLKPILSGNYIVTIYEDGKEDTPVSTVCFSVVDPLMTLSASVSTNTEIDWNDSHQQVSFEIAYNGLRIFNPAQEIKTYVCQNRRSDNAVINAPFNYQTGSGLKWEHNRTLIFNAGNEYRKFEILNTHRGSMGIDKIDWFDPFYHATLIPDKPRKNYIYDEDQDGNYYIRTDEYGDNDTQSDYLFIHFRLETEARLDGDYYVNGGWSYDRFLPEYKMTYNPEERAYEATVLLKQGYYNYQYLFVPHGSKQGLTDLIEGNFYQTENEYIIYIYYSPQGSRYDQLVGFRRIRFAPNQ